MPCSKAHCRSSGRQEAGGQSEFHETREVMSILHIRTSRLVAICVIGLVLASAYAVATRSGASGLRGAQVTSARCGQSTVGRDVRLITGKVHSIRVCPEPMLEGMAASVIVLTPAHRGSDFRTMRSALEARDGSRRRQNCLSYADGGREVYVVTSNGIWLAHLPVDVCSHYTRAVYAALAATTPIPSPTATPSNP